MNKGLVVILVLLCCSAGNAQIIVNYQGGTNSPIFTDPSASASDLLAGSDLTGVNFNSSGVITADNWTTSASPSLASSFSFTLAPQLGNSLSLTSIQFDFRPQGSGPQQVGVDYVLNGSRSLFGSYSGIATYNIWAPFTATGSLDIASGESVTIYVLGFNSRNTGKTLDLNNIIVNGVAVPEPSTWAFLLLGGLGLASFSLRQKNKT